MLRLSSATIGPIAVATAGPTDTQTLEAYNAGDGSLTLDVSDSNPWIKATVGASRQCRTIVTAVGKTCSTINVAVNTAGLPQGYSTGTLTVKAANAVDAPQAVIVTVHVGPYDAYAAPGKGRSFEFATATHATAVGSTQSGGNWLALVDEGFGSFRFDYEYLIQMRPPEDIAPGTYDGSVKVTGSASAVENQTIPVTMRTTTLPVAVPSTFLRDKAPSDRLTIRLAEGAPALQYPFSPIVYLTNEGAGTLTTSDTSVSGGSWLKKDVLEPFFAIDPAGLPVGTSSGTITFTTNAVNGTVTVPVDLQIVPKGDPLIFYQGVLDNGTFIPGDTVAQGDIMVVKGEQLSFDPYTPGGDPPLKMYLGKTSVLVNGSAVPLFYTSYGQIAFQMPVDTPLGTAFVRVKRDDGQPGNTASVQVAARAPRLLVAVNQDYSINSAASPAHAGGYITVYSIGFGETSPAVATGATAPSAEPLARVTVPTQAAFGSGIDKVLATPVYAGMTPGFAGLYQVNVQVPAAARTGKIDLVISAGDTASNALPLYVE